MISLSAARAPTGELTLVTNAGRRNRHPQGSIFAPRRPGRGRARRAPAPTGLSGARVPHAPRAAGQRVVAALV